MLLERPRAGWAGGLDDDEEADAGPRHYEAAGDCAAWLAHSALAQRLWTLAFGEALLGGGREARRETHETRETRGGETRARSALLTAPALLVAQEAARDGGAWDGAAAWSAAFATRTHGRSWAALQARVAGAAASLVVVRARGGAVFGGIADAALAPRPAFAGGAAARLLALGPARIAAFTPSGINANFVYFNAGAQTLPNGIGFGGQIGYFGLWVDAGLDAGHSMARPACTTFASPRLSDEDTFDVDEIEIWCLRRVEVDERLVDPAARGPGMGRAQEEAFLEMAGRTMHAKTLPEPDRGAE
nr:hypothetical protein HK105_003708 [Polyrhizophydium stewartii]